jgi:pyrimidine operon attenuation protein/uracil phosphoribosyltransferase
MYRDDLYQQPTRSTAPTDVPVSNDDMTVVLVDDVLYSGRTVRAALDALTDLAAHRLSAWQFSDRGHRELPTRADFAGKPSSAHGERINVRLVEHDRRWR